MHRIALAFVVLASLAATARADYYPSSEKWQKHIELQIAMDMGGIEVGPFDSGFAFGGDISVLVPLTQKLGVRGEGRFSGFSESGYEIENPIGGIQSRLGVAVQWRFWDIVPRENFMRIGFHLEGGVGRHEIRWDEGGVLTRNDVGGGLGFHFYFRDGHGKNEQTFGFFWDFQMTVARAPGKAGEPNCQVICDEPTPPYHYDFAPGMRMGFAYGF